MVQARDSCAAHRQEDIVDVLLSISRVSHRLANNLALLRKQRMTNGGKPPRSAAPTPSAPAAAGTP